MDIRITDHGNIWVDGKQYIGLDRMNQLLQEKGAIDYDRIQAIVAEAVKPAEITEEQVVEWCKRRNYSIYASGLIDERLASQYRLGYHEGVKDSGGRFEALKSQLLDKFFKRLAEWTTQNKDRFYTSHFAYVENGLDAAREALEVILREETGKPTGDGCGFVD